MTGNDEPEEHSSSDGVPTLSAWATDQAWLADADRDHAAERVHRLAGDRELAVALRANGYRGRDYELFANEIAKWQLLFPDSIKYLCFTGEMPIDGPTRHLCRIGDIRQRCVGYATCRKLPDSRLNQLLPGLLSFFFLFPRHRQRLATHKVYT